MKTTIRRILLTGAMLVATLRAGSEATYGQEGATRSPQAGAAAPAEPARTARSDLLRKIIRGTPERLVRTAEEMAADVLAGLEYDRRIASLKARERLLEGTRVRWVMAADDTSRRLERMKTDLGQARTTAREGKSEDAAQRAEAAAIHRYLPDLKRLKSHLARCEEQVREGQATIEEVRRERETLEKRREDARLGRLTQGSTSGPSLPGYIRRAPESAPDTATRTRTRPARRATGEKPAKDELEDALKALEDLDAPSPPPEPGPSASRPGHPSEPTSLEEYRAWVAEKGIGIVLNLDSTPVEAIAQAAECFLFEAGNRWFRVNQKGAVQIVNEVPSGCLLRALPRDKWPVHLVQATERYGFRGAVAMQLTRRVEMEIYQVVRESLAGQANSETGTGARVAVALTWDGSGELGVRPVAGTATPANLTRAGGRG